MDDKVLKKRLEEVIYDVEDVAAERVMAAFPEFFDNMPGDAPVHPLTYLDDNDATFRDAHGRYFFWNETFSEHSGPYSDEVTMCSKMLEYAAELSHVVQKLTQEGGGE